MGINIKFFAAKQWSIPKKFRLTRSSTSKADHFCLEESRIFCIDDFCSVDRFTWSTLSIWLLCRSKVASFFNFKPKAIIEKDL